MIGRRGHFVGRRALALVALLQLGFAVCVIALDAERTMLATNVKPAHHSLVLAGVRGRDSEPGLVIYCCGHCLLLRG